MTQREALMKFGSAVPTKVIERLEALTFRAEGSMYAWAEQQFGRTVVSQAYLGEMREVLHWLVESVANEVAGEIGVERYKDAQQASANMLKAALAGIKLGEGVADDPA